MSMAPDLRPDLLPLGAPFAIGAALFAALDGDPLLAGATRIDNPVRASELADGARIVFFEDVADEPAGQEGGRQTRRYRFNLGVISRASDGDARRTRASVW